MNEQESKDLLSKGCGTIQAANAAIAAHAEAQKQRSEEVRQYGHRLECMSRNQLRGELKRQLKHQPGQKEAGIELLALSIIFDSTRAPDNPKGRVGISPV